MILLQPDHAANTFWPRVRCATPERVAGAGVIAEPGRTGPGIGREACALVAVLPLFPRFRLEGQALHQQVSVLSRSSGLIGVLERYPRSLADLSG